MKKAIAGAIIAVRDDLRQTCSPAQYAALVEPYKTEIRQRQTNGGQTDVAAAQSIIDQILESGGSRSMIPAVLAALADLRDESGEQ